MSPKPTIVCLHGLGRTSKDWSLVMPQLEHVGSVITPDLPRNFAAALDAATRAVTAGAIVIGHSYGALLALHIAAQTDTKVSAVILTDSFFPPAKNGRSTLTTLKDYLWHRYKFITTARRTALPVGTPAKGVSGLNSLLRIAFHRSSFEAMTSSLSMPMLVVHCTDDHYVPVAFARAAAQRHPTWTYLELPIGGHYPHLRDPAGWLSTVLPWLEGLD